jgi:hypothetical protein
VTYELLTPIRILLHRLACDDGTSPSKVSHVP